jgi:curved DNA-binding protein CbpA
MKAIDELDYYELLEIPSSASPAEIERAYRLAQQTWADGSLALYSVFENADAAVIRSRLDEAYGVLLDPEARRLHDRERMPKDAPLSSAASSGLPSLPGSPSGHAGSPDSRGPTAEAIWSAGGFRELREDEPSRDRSADVERGLFGVEDRGEDYDAFEDEETGDFDGVRLRRARLFRGYEIDEISQVTKVSGTHLRNIEDENYAELPADVYVRGFVTAYARTIGLDPARVVPGYMARLQESRNEGSRSRFLGRR